MLVHFYILPVTNRIFQMAEPLNYNSDLCLICNFHVKRFKTTDS